MDAVAAVTVGEWVMCERGDRGRNGDRGETEREIKMEKGESREGKIGETIGNSGLLCQKALT